MITSKIIASGIIRAIGTVVLLALLLFFLYEIQAILLYLCISLIICLISNPFISFLRTKLKFGKTFAAATTLILLVLLLIGFVLLFIPLIISQASNLSLLDTNALQNHFYVIEKNIGTYFNIDHSELKTIIKKLNLTSQMNFSFLTSFINSMINLLAGFGMGLVSVIFITFFIMRDQNVFKEKVKSILPEGNREKILNSIAKTNHLLTRYFIGLLLQLIVVFILYYIVLIIFGSENAFIIAFLCAVLNVIPYIGPLIGTVLAGILTMISNIGTDFRTQMLPATIYVVIGFLVVQAIDNNISQPIISSKSVNSHPLEIFLVTLISGITFGILGMVIAVPTFTILKVVAKEFFPENKIVSVLTEKI